MTCRTTILLCAFLLGSATLTSCKPVSKPAQSTGLIEEAIEQPAPEKPRGPALLVLRAGKLTAVSLANEPLALAKVAPKIVELEQSSLSWCAIDHHAGVLWYSTPSATKAFDLFGMSLTTGKSARIASDSVTSWFNVRHPSATTPLITDRWIYEHSFPWFAVDPSQPRSALTVQIPDFCYEDRYDPDLGLTPECDAAKASLEARAQSMSYNDQAALKALLQRGVPLDVNDRGRESDVPVVKEDDCVSDFPEVCGDSVRLGDTKWYSVVVGASQGDYIHEYKQLYRPDTKTFANPCDPTQTSDKPIKNAEGELVNVDDECPTVGVWAPGTDAFFVNSPERMEVRSLSKGVVVEADQICGWLEPGIIVLD